MSERAQRVVLYLFSGAIGAVIFVWRVAKITGITMGRKAAVVQQNVLLIASTGTTHTQSRHAIYVSRMHLYSQVNNVYRK